MKCVLITGDNLRHRNFTEKVCSKVEVEHVIFERKLYPSAALFEKERQYMYADNSLCASPKQSFTLCNSGQANSKMVEGMLKAIAPDYIFTFGCSLLKPHIFNIPSEGCINIHTGLVQYHRGVDSSTWAIMDGYLDRVGATIHYIDESIDAGQVIYQRWLDLGRLSVKDDLDDIFLKTCDTGVEALLDVIKTIPNLPSMNVGKGKLYQKKHMTDEIIIEAGDKLAIMLGDLK